MKNEAKLRMSYEKQKSQFQEAKDRKIRRLLNQKKQIEDKILTLQRTMREVDETISRVQKEPFQVSFEDYLQQSRQQSLNAVTTKKISSNPSFTDQGSATGASEDDFFKELL